MRFPFLQEAIEILHGPRVEEAHRRERDEREQAGRDDREQRVPEVDLPDLARADGRAQPVLEQEPRHLLARLDRGGEVPLQDAAAAQAFVQHETGHVLVLVDVVDVAVHERAQAVLDPLLRAQRLAEPGHELPAPVLEYGLVELFLGAEIIVQQRAVDPRVIRDLLQSRAVPPLAGEYRKRGVEDPLFGIRRSGRGRSLRNHPDPRVIEIV